MSKLDGHPLNLDGLTIEDIDFTKGMAEIDAKHERLKKECKEKYGDDWWEHYLAATNPKHGIDSTEEWVNKAIYEGYTPLLSGTPILVEQTYSRYYQKLKELFGPLYKFYIHHKPNHPYVNRALIKDALKQESGKNCHMSYKMNIISRQKRRNTKGGYDMSKLDGHPLNLDGLTIEDVDFNKYLPQVTAEIDKIEQECKEKYGDDWFEYFYKLTNPDHDVDSTERLINKCIYEGHIPVMSGDPEVLYQTYTRFYDKLKRLFGPLYKLHIYHKSNHPYVNKLLVKDALKTGKWKELPYELQDKYHKQAAKKNT